MLSQLESTRRQLFSSAGTGVGVAALAGLLGPSAAVGAGNGTNADAIGGLPELPHLSPSGQNISYSDFERCACAISGRSRAS